ncbi:MAG: hypothetical protein AAFR75_08015 [Pseudomonadota bacterium]
MTVQTQSDNVGRSNLGVIVVGDASAAQSNDCNSVSGLVGAFSGDVTIQRAGLDTLSSSIQSLSGRCSTLIVCAQGQDSKHALAAAVAHETGVQAIVIVDPELRNRTVPTALFSGLAVFSVAGLLMAGWGRNGARKQSAIRLGDVRQPVLLLSGVTGGGAQNRSVRTLQSQLGGLVEFVALPDGLNGQWHHVSGRIARFAEQVSTRLAKMNRRRPSVKPVSSRAA